MSQASCTSLIRKIRKKLRQIETLTRSDRELTFEEQEKVDSKETLREQLRVLLKEQEATLNVLDKDMQKSSVHNRHTEEHFDQKKADELSSVNSEVNDREQPVENVDIHSVIVSEDLSVNPPHICSSSSDEAGPSVNTPVRSESSSIANPPVLASNDRTSKSPVVVKSPSHDTLFKDLHLQVTLLEGHHEDICSLDVHEKYIVSGGRDTSLKLWDSSSFEELRSFGGHEGTISALSFMKDRPFNTIPSVITACSDCTLRVWDMDKGEMKKSIYVYSPVLCLDYSNSHAAIGTEGGKVEMYNIVTGNQLFTVNAYQSPVTAVKFMNNESVASGCVDGFVHIYQFTDKKKPLLFSLDPDTITIKTMRSTTDDLEADKDVKALLHLTKVNCMTVWNDLIIYGDGGFNLKVLDFKRGVVTKLRTNLKDFCPTECVHVANIHGQSYLVSVGSDVDNGNCYINIRLLPSFAYLGTIRDVNIECGFVTSIGLQELNKQLFFVTGGNQLRVWNQVRRGKKRKGSQDQSDVIPCKFITNFTDTRHSDLESDEDDDDVIETSQYKDSSTGPNKENDINNDSWCVLS